MRPNVPVGLVKIGQCSQFWTWDVGYAGEVEAANYAGSVMRNKENAADGHQKHVQRIHCQCSFKGTQWRIKTKSSGIEIKTGRTQYNVDDLLS